jgi:hypothetical protein
MFTGHDDNVIIIIIIPIIIIIILMIPLDDIANGSACFLPVCFRPPMPADARVTLDRQLLELVTALEDGDDGNGKSISEVRSTKATAIGGARGSVSEYSELRGSLQYIAPSYSCWS